MTPIVIQPKPKGLKEFNVFSIDKMKQIMVQVLPPWESLCLTNPRHKLPPEWYILKGYLFEVRIDGERELLSFEQLGILGKLILAEAVQ